MNSVIKDNRVVTVQQYLTARLAERYSERESSNIVSELFRHYKNWSRTDIVLNRDNRLTEAEILKFHFAGKRLAKGEPLQYILGSLWFADCEIRVTPDVLIPRPETEELVELVVAKNKFRSPRILDIGTGSGCIALAMKKKIPGAFVNGIDVSEAAVALSKENAERNKLEVDFITGNILEADALKNQYDILVSNPPYIPIVEKDSLSSSVVEHEPHLALFVPDSNPLLFYKKILDLSQDNLNPGGMVFCEIHENMLPLLEAELRLRGIENYEFVKDMQGKNRMFYFEKEIKS